MKLSDHDQPDVRSQLITHELWTIRNFFFEVLIVEIQLVVIRPDLAERLQVGVDVPSRCARTLDLLGDVSVPSRAWHQDGPTVTAVDDSVGSW